MERLPPVSVFELGMRNAITLCDDICVHSVQVVEAHSILGDTDILVWITQGRAYLNVLPVNTP
jgi:hypothetical protein